MKIFFDTEFTGLTSDPRLMSIGMVSEHGQELYIELTDGWTDAMCSPWVQRNVMPVFGKGEQLSRREAGERIAAWLALQGADACVLGDSDYDTTLLAQLIDESGVDRSHYRIELLAFNSKAQAKLFEAKKRQYFESQPGNQHHALHDAHAFRAAWNSVFAPDREVGN